MCDEFDKSLFQYVLTVISLILFLRGFFPVQYTLPNDSFQPTSLNGIKFKLDELYKPVVDRVIFIVIDALRWDFLTQENFPFLVSAFREHGCVCKVTVQSPTVTLPRIKALTAGRVPQFVDVILNLVGTSSLNDSILHQAKVVGKKIVFYGDDTWLKLYPDVFERFEGVSSFFVNDYTEVDNNVTNNVVRELNNFDWDIMFLHYLGLDHIGHVLGPFSTLVQPKLLEMDEVFRTIYHKSKLWNKKTLIVVTGDHGMKDSGGHGGSTEAETYVPFVVVGLSCTNDSIKQIDIPATLSVLLGLKLPSGSIGRAVLNMLITLSPDQRLYVLNYISTSLKSVSAEYGDSFNNATALHYNFLLSNNTDDAIRAEFEYQSYINKVTENLLQSSTIQDDYVLLISLLVILNFLCVSFYNLCNSKNGLTIKNQLGIVIILIIQLLPRLLLTTVLTIGVLSYSLVINVIKLFRCIKPNDIGFISFCTILHILSLQSSSFIEEEHQTWYFILGSCILLTGYKLKQYYKLFDIVSIFVCIRIMRTLNPAGDKWSHLPTLSNWLVLEENHIFYQMLFCTSLILTYICCNKLLKRHSVLIPPILILIYLFRVYYEKSPVLGKIIWIAVGLNFVLEFCRSKNYIEQFVVTWILLCSLLMRPYNLVLLPSCVYSCLVIQQYVKNARSATIINLWIGRVFFFAQGNGNSLASIDVASGYVGLQSYIPSIVFLQIVCHSYTFPVLVNILTLRRYWRYYFVIWETCILYRLLALTSICIAVLIQRHHLFVWSVFAPKLLIESFNCVELLVELLMFRFMKMILDKTITCI